METLKDLNVCSQKGLVEMFDGSIGAGSVFMPHGGKYQMTETQAMVAKLPVLKGDCDTVTMMSYGFDPYLSSWSPYHGAVYAVTESVAKLLQTEVITGRSASHSRNISVGCRKIRIAGASRLQRFLELTAHRSVSVFRPLEERTVCPVHLKISMFLRPLFLCSRRCQGKGYHYTGA